MANAPTRRPLDRFLLLEVALVLALVGLALAFFLVPVSDGAFQPAWWVVPMLAVLFFGVVALHVWRRKRGGRLALLRAEVREKRGTEDGEP